MSPYIAQAIRESQIRGHWDELGAARSPFVIGQGTSGELGQQFRLIILAADDPVLRDWRGVVVARSWRRDRDYM